MLQLVCLCSGEGGGGGSAVSVYPVVYVVGKVCCTVYAACSMQWCVVVGEGGSALYAVCSHM